MVEVAKKNDFGTSDQVVGVRAMVWVDEYKGSGRLCSGGTDRRNVVTLFGDHAVLLDNDGGSGRRRALGSLRRGERS